MVEVNLQNFIPKDAFSRNSKHTNSTLNRRTMHLNNYGSMCTVYFVDNHA